MVKAKCKGGLAMPAAPFICSMGNFKVLKFTTEVFPLDIEAVNARNRRPFAAPIDEIVDLSARAFGHRLHPSV